MAFHDASELRAGTTVDCDICVVGSGPAGLAVAEAVVAGSRSAGRSRPQVVVLEGNDGGEPHLLPRRPGGSVRGIAPLYRDLDTATQHRYDGAVGGWLSEACPRYLRTSRLRAFGGTSTVWSGWWLPLEDDDFTAAFGDDAVAWPLSARELRPFYRAVHDAHELGPYAYDDPALLRTHLGTTPAGILPLGDAGVLRTRIVLVRRVDSGARLRRAAESSDRLHVYVNANVTGLETTATGTGRAVDRVMASAPTLDGQRPFGVRARTVVLAAGALENVRLLLISGLGDAGGHVGRHFREHPYLWVSARLDLPDRWRATHPLYFAPLPTRLGTSGTGAIAALTVDPSRARRSGIGSFRAVLGGDVDVPGTVNLCWEQSAGRDSRVTLDDAATDDLGLPRLRIDPVVTPTDRRTGRHAVADVTAALAELGIATVELPPLDEDPWSWRRPGRVTAGNHPTGVTRMAATAAEGVADRDCRVFGTTNLFLTGSGLFPRAGHANPTFTIAALARRLGEHLLDLR